MNYKNLLIISHNCLSKTGSNGRTLANYLKGWPKDKLAQFFIHAEKPDFAICENYYCITDANILRSMCKRKMAGNVINESDFSDGYIDLKDSAKKAVLKNSALLTARDLAWKSPFWKKKRFRGWLDAFSPELILVQVGDMGFLFDLAIKISKKYHAPIVVYNTEGFYFKERSYFGEKAFTRCFYPLFHGSYKRAYKRLIKASTAQIYNCDLLRNDYETIFHTDSRTIMCTSEFTSESVFYPKKNQIIYAGNLGLYRHKSLIEFADALQATDGNLVVDVYGKAPCQKVREELENCAGIRLHGFISYEELKQKLRESKYLLHVESFDAFYKNDLKYAFSTKIADSLAAGACLFVYAPENMAVCQYLCETNAAVLITEQSDLQEQLKRVLLNEAVSEECAQNGRELAERNHNLEVNRLAFQNILLGEENQT